MNSPRLAMWWERSDGDRDHRRGADVRAVEVGWRAFLHIELDRRGRGRKERIARNLNR